MYPTREAAKKLGPSLDHVNLLAREGKIEAKKVGRDWVITDFNLPT